MDFSSDSPCLFINPAYRPMAGSRRPVIDPATLEMVGAIAAASEAEIDAALTAAAKAQTALEGARRQDAARSICTRVANAIEAADFTRCAELMVREMGKPYPEAIGEIANCAPVFRYYAEMARDEAGKIAGTTQAGSFQYARYEPYGVSVHIMPYNFPILLMCWTVAASLAAGNACVIKPAEATTLSTLDYMAVFRSLPEGLVSCLPGGAETAQALIASDAYACGRLHRLGGGGHGRRGRLRRADEALRHRGGRQRPDDRHRACAAGGRGGRRGDRRVPPVRPGLHLGRALLRRR